MATVKFEIVCKKCKEDTGWLDESDYGIKITCHKCNEVQWVLG